ncbi:MAG: gliding motility lipoprotein GldH [Bacteroidetes bacterium]|nr:gliding motility lipoprotein GldH [Bacteroidota bacterium]MBS1633055.1 gliding motility lipoprotein GldH [Bacteroidota bacterium]
MKQIKTSLFLITTTVLFFVSCTTIDLYEKDVNLPQHQWKSSFKPVFTFDIKDTTVPYRFFLVLRHTEKYSFTNIYLNLYIKAPGSDSTIKIRQSLMLADNNGWMGSGMDDIYEHRIPLGDPQLLKAGIYTFTLEQIMREDPLEHVLNVGLRIEKKK